MKTMNDTLTRSGGRVRRIAGRAAVIGTAIGAVGVTAIATGAIPTGDGTIRSCYDANGSLRVIDSDIGQACRTTEKPLTFNQRGPKGDTGATGATGPAGPAGTVSPVRATACAGTCTADYYSETLTAYAGCPYGKRVLGGGFAMVAGRYSDGTIHPVQVQRNEPYPGYDYWVVTVKTKSLSFNDLKVTVICT